MVAQVVSNATASQLRLLWGLLLAVVTLVLAGIAVAGSHDEPYQLYEVSAYMRIPIVASVAYGGVYVTGPLALFGGMLTLGMGYVFGFMAVAGFWTRQIALAFFAVLAIWLSSIIDNQRKTISKMTQTDPLTGVANRRALTARLSQLMKLRNRPGLAVLYLDLDKFKQINTDQGHAEGDKRLQQVGETILSALRDGDTVARVGGDEFVLCLPEIDTLDELHLACQRVLSTVSAVQPATVGAVLLKPNAAVRSPDEVIDAADRLLLDLKQRHPGSYTAVELPDQN